MVTPFNQTRTPMAEAYLGRRWGWRVMISTLDLLYLTYLLDVRVEVSGRQLDT
jgi:hypothetical protein